jgi:hypothetical protein
MELRTRNATRAIGGAVAALAAVAIAVPAISAADGGHNDGHRGATVGTVDSFDATTGTLTITPTSGDPISGMVTDRTKIQCRNHDDNGDDHGDDGPNHDVGDDHGDDGPNHDVGDDHGNHGGSGHGKRSHGGSRGNCSTDALVAGAMVEDANLDLGPTGLTFEEVELN